MAASAPTSPWPSTTSCRARRRYDCALRGNGADAALAGAVQERGTRSCGQPRLDRSPPPQTLWPIIQGGIHDELRLRSLEGTLERGPWTGIAIGGLSVGEPKPVMHRILELLEPGPAAGDPPLSYGRRISGRSAGGNRARRRPVRLRRGHAERPPRHRLAADRAGQRQGRGAQGLDRAARSRAATARPAPRTRGAICGTCSWWRTCWDCGWSRSTTSGSWSGWASRPASAHPGRHVRRLEPRVARPRLCTRRLSDTRDFHRGSRMLQAQTRHRLAA